MRKSTVMLIIGHVFISVLIYKSISAPLDGDSPGSPEEETSAQTPVDVVEQQEETLQDTSDVSEEKAMNYLSRYGFLSQPVTNTSGQASALIDITEAIRGLQHMAGIEETGILDEPTKKVMKLKRCGNSEKNNINIKKRRKRYSIEGSKWARNTITYKISSYSSDLALSTQEEDIRRAFDTWAAVTPLRFIQVTSDRYADIEIKFARGYHGDSFPFDGPGSTLAHAFFPRWGGDAHFDDDEYFTSKSRYGVDLFQVVAHELGHSLGLGHSSDQNALMAAFYRGYIPDFRLHSDDISGIQRLYGSNTNPVTTTTTTTTRRPDTPAPTLPPTLPPSQLPTSAVPTKTPDTTSICRDAKFDAVTQYEGNTYIFKGSIYARIGESGMMAGYPKPIAQDWQGLPSDLDTAIHWPAIYQWQRVNSQWSRTMISVGRTYFFKGSQYWRFDENIGLRPGYPKLISQGFPGLPNNLDAAFVWSGNGRIYFMKGTSYYRYSRGQGVDSGYPRPLSVWGGLPSTIDAAFQYTNGKTYFFSNTLYYRFNDGNLNVDSSYPRDNAQWWLGCPGNMIGSLEMREIIDQFDDVESNVDLNEIQITDEKENSKESTGAGQKLSTVHPLCMTAIVVAVLTFRHEF